MLDLIEATSLVVALTVTLSVFLHETVIAEMRYKERDCVTIFSRKDAARINI